METNERQTTERKQEDLNQKANAFWEKNHKPATSKRKYAIMIFGGAMFLIAGAILEVVKGLESPTGVIGMVISMIGGIFAWLEISGYRSEHRRGKEIYIFRDMKGIMRCGFVAPTLWIDDEYYTCARITAIERPANSEDYRIPGLIIEINNGNSRPGRILCGKSAKEKHLTGAWKIIGKQGSMIHLGQVFTGNFPSVLVGPEDALDLIEHSKATEIIERQVEWDKRQIACNVLHDAWEQRGEELRNLNKNYEAQKKHTGIAAGRSAFLTIEIGKLISMLARSKEANKGGRGKAGQDCHEFLLDVVRTIEEREKQLAIDDNALVSDKRNEEIIILQRLHGQHPTRFKVLEPVA